MKPPAWWPPSVLDCLSIILGIILTGWVNIEWYNHQSWPYPMEGAPPSNELHIAMFYTSFAIFCVFVIISQFPIKRFKIHYWSSVPLIIAGFTNFLWPYHMFNSAYGEMSGGYWSCGYVGGTYSFVWFALAPLGYVIGVKPFKSETLAWYLVAGSIIFASLFWYRLSWII